MVFLNFDRCMKCNIAGYNRTVTFKLQTTTAKTTGDVRDTFKCKRKGKNDGSGIGVYVPNTIPASKSYWKARLLDVLVMSRELGKPNFFTTLTLNDDWPKLRSYINDLPTILSPTIALILWSITPLPPSLHTYVVGNSTKSMSSKTRTAPLAKSLQRGGPTNFKNVAPFTRTLRFGVTQTQSQKIAYACTSREAKTLI